MSPEAFHAWVDGGFEELGRHKASLFGVYPVKNLFFMKDSPVISYDLRFCVGTLWGCINRKDLLITIDEKEDFERTLLCYEQDGCVVRYNRITIKTTFYTMKGGMQHHAVDRKEAAKASCRYLLERFPQFTRLYTGKKNGMWEVRIKART